MKQVPMKIRAISYQSIGDIEKYLNTLGLGIFKMEHCSFNNNKAYCYINEHCYTIRIFSCDYDTTDSIIAMLNEEFCNIPDLGIDYDVVYSIHNPVMGSGIENFKVAISNQSKFMTSEEYKLFLQIAKYSGCSRFSIYSELFDMIQTLRKSIIDRYGIYKRA